MDMAVQQRPSPDAPPIDTRAVDDVITVAQAARESGFSVRTLWRHIQKGALPVIRRGPFRRPRIKRADFDRYLNTN